MGLSFIICTFVLNIKRYIVMNLRVEIITPFLKNGEVWIPTLRNFVGWESSNPPTKDETTQRIVIKKVLKHKIKYEFHAIYGGEVEVTLHCDKIKDFLLDYNPIDHVY